MFSFEEQDRHIKLAGLSEVNIRIPKIGDGTLEALRNALRDAVKNLFPGSYPMIIGTWEDRVVVEIEQQGKTLLFEIPYEVLKASIKIGTPVKVQKKVSFVKSEAKTGLMTIQSLFTEAQQRDQRRLAGLDDDTRAVLNEGKPGRVELRESLFDSGSVRILSKEVLLESGKVVNPMVIAGKAAKVGTTANNRYYSEKLWKTTIPKAMDKIKNSKLLGQLDHPLPEGAGGRLAQTAVKITRLGLAGNFLTYEAEVLNTPTGKVLKQLLSGGVGIGMSTRGFGETRKGKINGQQVEIIDESDYDLVGIDLVVDPAVGEAGIEYFKS